MPTINIMLPSEPEQGQDPLGELLSLPLFRNCLAQIGLDPDKPTQVERQGTQSVNFHFEKSDAGFALSTLLNRYRRQFRYTSGLVMPEKTFVPPSDLPPDTIVALGKIDAPPDATEQ